MGSALSATPPQDDSRKAAMVASGHSALVQAGITFDSGGGLRSR
jgi:hypothetical protein